MTASLVAAFLAVLLTGVSQLLFKLGALRAEGAHWLRVYVNPRTVLAYTLLFAATLLNTYAYKILPLKLSVVVLPFTFLVVGALSRLVLEERFSRYHAIGAALVAAGIAVYNAGAL